MKIKTLIHKSYPTKGKLKKTYFRVKNTIELKKLFAKPYHQKTLV